MGALSSSTVMLDGEPAVFHFITVDGTRLRYLDRGNGIPVLLLHGNGSMIEDFASCGIMDAPGYRFVAFDRPGERARLEQLAREKVDPDALAVVCESVESCPQHV